MSKPSIKQRSRERICPECGGDVVRKSKHGRFPTFCSQECKVSHNNRHAVEGRAIIAYAKAWRRDRGSGEIAKEAFQQMTAITDHFNADDLKAGRPRADLYAAKLLASDRNVMDFRFSKRMTKRGENLEGIDDEE